MGRYVAAMAGYYYLQYVSVVSRSMVSCLSLLFFLPIFVALSCALTLTRAIYTDLLCWITDFASRWRTLWLRNLTNSHLLIATDGLKMRESLSFELKSTRHHRESARKKRRICTKKFLKTRRAVFPQTQVPWFLLFWNRGSALSNFNR